MIIICYETLINASIDLFINLTMDIISKLIIITLQANKLLWLIKELFL